MSKYYYGNEISEYGQDNGYVDYRAFAQCFEGVLNNNIIPATDGIIGYWDLISGDVYNEYDEPVDVFQYYIVNEGALYYLEQNNEIVYYNDTLDCYVWAVTHYGTAWSHVLTDIKIGV